MSHDLICAWLGLPAGVWPPDHYSLLGLKPGENDPDRIEESVHQRLDAVRRYQMTHPEQATEAMNRIAQAFVCLSEPASKRVYDVALLGAAAEAPADRGADDRDPLVLVYNPAGDQPAPPVRVTYDPAAGQAAPPVRVTYDPAAGQAPPPVRRPQVVPPPLPPSAEPIPLATAVALEPAAAVSVEPILVAEPADPLAEAARSAPARRGLHTKRQLYHRIVRTRKLLELWNQAGMYLASPKRRVSRLADVNELMRVLRTVRDELRGFPPVLGEAGQAGYLVLALTQLNTPPVLAALAPAQREALSRDWQAGRTLLDGHRDYLRQEARAMRRRTLSQRLGRFARTFVAERPGALLVLVAVLALNTALFRTYVVGWVYHLIKPPPANVTSDP
jgi:hypothetical protein